MSRRVTCCVAFTAPLLALTACSGIASAPTTSAPAKAATSARGTGASSGPSPTASSSSTGAAPSTSSTSSEPASSSGTEVEDPQGRLTAESLEDAFEGLQKQVKGSLAIAWMPVGGSGSPESLGTTRDIDAWSTMKVPIGVANVVKSGGTLSSSTTATMRRMITYSDNNAAIALWQRLGSRDTARAKVEDVVRRAGDATTRVRRVSFGLTDWAVPDQARFAAGVACLEESKPVLTLMGQVVAEQRWGLGSIAGSRFKGGWGPSEHGYLMRQLGILTLEDGSQVAIAIATQPRGSSHPVGATNLSKAAAWLSARLTSADGGHCD